MNVFELFEAKKKSLKNPADNPCWTDYHPVGTKQKSGRTVPNCMPNEGVEEAANAAQQAAIAIAKKKKSGVAEAKHQPRWEVEQRTAGHHSAFYIVRGHSKPREVWKDSRGMSDFKNKSAAEDKATELNSQEMTEAFQDDGKMDWDAWKQKAKQHGAVKFVDTDNKTIAYDKNSKQVSSITWSSKKKGVAEASPRQHPKRYQSAIDSFNRFMDEPESTPKDELQSRHDQTKKRIKTNTMAGPKGVLPEQDVAEGKPQKRADRYHINKDGKPASLASYADRASAVKDRDAKYPDAKVHQVGPRGKVKGEFEEGMSENWGEPLTGWHVVYARTGNKVSGTPDFDSRDSAQKYLMTKMSANHHNYRVAHADNLGTSAPTPMGGYLESKGMAEAGHAGADDTDTVGFYLDTERAYQAVMGRYGDMIDHDETSGIMYVPARLWPKIEMIAFDADGIGALRDDDLENPEHYGIAEAAVMESRLQEMRAAGYDIL